MNSKDRNKSVEQKDRNKSVEQMEREAMTVYALIPWGKDRAISREKLVRYTGLSDREVRDRIKLLSTLPCTREQPILSSSGHKGYWFSCEPAEIQACIAESDHRIITELFNTWYMRRFYSRITGQKMRLRVDVRKLLHHRLAQRKEKEERA